MNSNLQKYLLAILGKKDYSQKELLLKSLAKGYTTTEAFEVLEWLKSKNFLNDERLATNLFQKFIQSKGKIWISQKLRQRQIPAEIITVVLDSEVEIADSLFLELKAKLSRKYKISDWQNLDPKIKSRVISFLNRNGFSDSYRMLENWKS